MDRRSVLAQIGYKYSSDPQNDEEDSPESTPQLATNGSILSTFKGASLIEPSVPQQQQKQQQQQTAEQNAKRKTLSATKLCRLDNNGVNLLLVIFTDLNPGFFFWCVCVLRHFAFKTATEQKFHTVPRCDRQYAIL